MRMTQNPYGGSYDRGFHDDPGWNRLPTPADRTGVRALTTQ
jgi:hypothetical protein